MSTLWRRLVLTAGDIERDRDRAFIYFFSLGDGPALLKLDSRLCCALQQDEAQGRPI